MLDERWIRSLHVEAMHRSDMHGGHDPHVLFQSSAIGALLEGSYDGDLTFAELAEQGDQGLGTLNGLDGEMIALDGSFYRADVEGRIHPVPPDARTPFAVVGAFEPSVRFELSGPLTHEELLAALDERIPEGAPSCAVRLDGRFASVRARSVPRQTAPYRGLAEVVADQHEFELRDTEGTMVGFRFPSYVEGIEVAGYHLHYIDRGRERGGHVLDSACERANAALDPSRDLHVELPPGLELGDPDLATETHAAIERAERC
jgi:acetolactate decarboxylase